jgi:hypothetical protein
MRCRAHSKDVTVVQINVACRTGASDLAPLPEGGCNGACHKVLPITKDTPITTTEVEVGNESLLISNNGYGDIRWLELVQKPA